MIRGKEAPQPISTEKDLSNIFKETNSALDQRLEKQGKIISNQIKNLVRKLHIRYPGLILPESIILGRERSYACHHDTILYNETRYQPKTGRLVNVGIVEELDAKGNETFKDADMWEIKNKFILLTKQC